ncbi:hypothetical protein [Sphingomonas yantingensis]|uniref:Uncharacterized protein n=1 Tax=Sphingomonas yantingensis TaxID=1241761 RepID=A0A7W9EGQ1_9SPHN|nr:hypothetical protein [Sphingomonas yantingensis]MBB5697169.1 hypothetical protein [Sphingomonas yantingensis]
MHTERVTFLATPALKATLTARAAAGGVSIGEYIRRKVEADDPEETEAAAELAAIVGELVEAIPDMKARLERTASTIEAAIEDSDRRLREAGLRQ